MSGYNKGIASNPIIHKFASSKGGKVRTKKGLATLSPERRREIASLGGTTSANRRRDKARQDQANSSMEEAGAMARIPGNVDEQVQE